MKYKTLDDFDTENSDSLSRKLYGKKKVSGFAGKRVLLRSDLNSEVDNGKVIEGERIKESAKTIKELRDKKAKVVVMAHQGRKGDKDFTDLKQHARLLNKYVKIKYVPDVIGDLALEAIGKLKYGEALLLENIRGLDEEMKPSDDNVIVARLKGMFDIYINDAFSVSHRAQTSIVSFPKFLDSGVGRVMQRELESLEKIKINDCLFLLGGNKVEDEMKILRKRDNILTAGVLAHVCLWAKGYKAGKENGAFEDILKYLPEVTELSKRKKIYLPLDLALRVNGKRKEVSVENFPSGEKSYDIGKRTVAYYAEKIKKAKAIFIKGTVGVCEEKEFCYGTRELLNAVVKSDAFSVVGGGHITTAMKKLKVDKKKFDYISLSGGALIAYICGEKLPGLEALERRGVK